jgi:predicted metalloprotease with PDZ domain
LQFCSRGFAKDKDYLNWLCLVSHEYFHTWNVKRIRPKGFGPFDYKKQFDSSMLWLAEGLTSFMDELFVYQCGLASTEEYLELQTKNLNRYYQTHGRKFHSLEVSGFNAWDVLYKPTENSKNSSVSYYLKGGIAFFLLNVLLVENNSSTKEFISRLWSWYKKDPSEGMEKEDVLLIIEELAGKFAREQFEEFIETTVEMPITEYLAKMGLSLEWESKNEIGFGADLEVRESRVYIRAVELDSAAFQSGLNSKDELISINNLRVDSKSYVDLFSKLEENKNYEFQVCRLGKIVQLNAMPKLIGKRIKSIKVENAALLEKFLIREIK